MNVAIIGGGASGMMLASMIDKRNSDIKVTLFERNSKLGKKLLLTGNGKCNFTSGEFNNLEKIYNSHFACDIYKKFNEKSFIDFFKSIGIDYRLEFHKGLKYYYPKSNKSTSVYYNLLDKIISNGIIIKYDSFITNITKNGNTFSVALSSGENYYFDKVVLATGGASYINTGSDGNGYDLAKKFSHNIVAPLPGLTSLKVKDFDLHALKGVRVDAKVSIIGHDDIFETGEIQFTEHGLSGIPILNISSKVNRLINNNEKISLKFDFLVDYEDLKKRINNISYKKQSDFLCGILPDELGILIMKRSGACLLSLVSDINDALFAKIYKNICEFSIDIQGCAGFDTAQITIGGVDICEVDANTLESKLIKGLYFSGEILDIDGKCGGYNLQLAYSTARCVCGGLLCNQI